MTIATVRQDLINGLEESGDGILLRTLTGDECIVEDNKEAFDCLQPDCWDSREYNLLLINSKGAIFFGRSIDFDFTEFKTVVVEPKMKKFKVSFIEECFYEYEVEAFNEDMIELSTLNVEPTGFDLSNIKIREVTE